MLDGGFGQLIADEYPETTRVKDGLWAAGVAVRHPQIIKSIHRRYLEAGADIPTTATYQASAQGYMDAGLAKNESEASDLFVFTLELAVQARYEVCSCSKTTPPFIVASLGSIGATLGNCREYTGDFGDGWYSDEAIYKFHLRRFNLLAQCLQRGSLKDQIDAVAIETIPSVQEAEMAVKAIAEVHRQNMVLPPACISFTTTSPGLTGHGEPIEDAIRVCSSSPHIFAVGINCVPIHIVPDMLAAMRKVAKLPLICYPNGQAWDGPEGQWNNLDIRISPQMFAEKAFEWIACGAGIVGGCCRTIPDHILAIAESVNKRN